MLYLDLETFSPVPIKHGTHAYAAQAEILLFAYAFDDGPVQVIDCTAGDYAANIGVIQTLMAQADAVCAHNSAFDRTVLRHNNVEIPISRWRDTMVKALAHSLSGSLGALCDVLGVATDKAKDKAGKDLIRLFCIPKIGKPRANRDTHPLEWARFVEYAALDIEAMREINRILPSWNYKGAELALWHLDQTINDRGVQMDVELARAAIRAVDRAQIARRLDCETDRSSRYESRA